VQRLGL